MAEEVKRKRGHPDGPTPKKEKLVQLIAAGNTWAAAYRQIYKADGMGSLGRLKKDPWVLNRLAELQGEAARNAVWSLERLIEQFLEDREFARSRGHASAAVQATMHIGKALGLYVDQRELKIVNEVDNMNKQQLLDFIREKTALLPPQERVMLIEHDPDEFENDEPDTGS